VALRILGGTVFLSSFGEYKDFGKDFTPRGGLGEWIRSFLARGAYLWTKPVLESIILPHARVCAFLTAYGELMIGLGLVAGVGGSSSKSGVVNPPFEERKPKVRTEAEVCTSVARKIGEAPCDARCAPSTGFPETITCLALFKLRRVG